MIQKNLASSVPFVISNSIQYGVNRLIYISLSELTSRYSMCAGEDKVLTTSENKQFGEQIKAFQLFTIN